MAFRFHLLDQVSHLTIGPDDKGRARDAHVLLPVHAPLLPDAVLLGDRVIGIGQQGEVELELVRELLHLRQGIGADAEHDEFRLVVLGERVPKPASLLGTAGCVGLGIKVEDDGALAEDLEKAKALIKDYGKPVEFKMLVTATPRGRTVGQVLQQLWKRAGINMEIEQVDQATIPPRAFMRQFQMTPWRIVDLADPDIQMFANFHTGSPVALANYSNPELDKLLQQARVTADQNKRNDLYCEISRHINKEAIWFWTFQNTYYAISTAKLKGLPKMYSGMIDVSRTWKE